nr:hypothetical protein [Myxococcota bacterium]
MSLVWRSVKAAGLCALVYGLSAGCDSSEDDGVSCSSEVCVDADPPDVPSGGRSATTTGGRSNLAGAGPSGGNGGNAGNGGSGTLPIGGEPGSDTPTGGAPEPGENGG